MTLPLYVGKNQWPSPTKKRKEDGPPLKHNILYMSKIIPKNKRIHKRNCSKNSTSYENMNKTDSPPPVSLEPAAPLENWKSRSVTIALSYLH